MQVTRHNDVKVYNLSAGKSLPQWLEEARKQSKSLRYDKDFRRRIDLIQDFEFNIASSRVRVAENGQYIAATGVYPPEVRIYDNSELGLKCTRGLNCEVVDFIFLAEDYRKMALLMGDRTLEFHAQYGFHHRLRVPKPGRTLAFDAVGCGLYVAGSSAEVVRMDLEAGTFLNPVALRQLTEVNALAVNPKLPVLSCAGDGGVVESYDTRDTSKPLQLLRLCESASPSEDTPEVTCCAYSSSGMQFAAGTSSGLVRVYDIRSSRPMSERDHMNGYAIKSVSFHARGVEEGGELCVGSADKKSIKIWDSNNGRIIALAESPHVIHQVEFVPNSGLLFVANDQPRIGIFFIPTLGLAPSWCSFLDNITEELEENHQQQEVFDDFRFVTTDQLEQLGATQLIGTKFLQPYMHGYFMDHRLYLKLKTAMDPFAFEEYRKQRIKQKLEAKRTMRTKLKAQVHVNQSLHRQLQEAADEGTTDGASKKRKEAAAKANTFLADERFQMLFADPDFAIEDKGPAKDLPEAAPLVAKLAAGKGKKRKKSA